MTAKKNPMRRKRGRPAKRRGQRKLCVVVYDCRGKMDDTGYGVIKGLLRESPDMPASEVAQALNIAKSTARRWMLSDEKPSSLARRRPPATSAAKRKAIQKRRTQVRKLLTKRDVKRCGNNTHVCFPTGTVRLASRALDAAAHPCRSRSTVYRDASALGLVCRARGRAPRQLAGDAKARVTFAKKLKALISKGVSIMWSDEKRFDSQDHGNRTQWVKKNQPTDPRHRSQAAHTIHVWGVINTDRSLCKLVVHEEVDPAAPRAKRGRPRKDEPPREKTTKRRTVTSDVYIEDCLKPVFAGMADATKRKVVLMQDGARAHTSKKSLAYLKDEAHVAVLDGWPARSPDLNPIEKCWAVLARKVSDRGPFSKEKLKEYVIAEWDALLRTKTVDRLIGAVSKRCDAVIKAQGAVV